jgi:O-acetyl-ADP-ribose deacetylase
MKEVISVVKDDITKIKVDAIVNAANSGLLGGGGVDGAIHKAGGPKILEECKIIRNRQGGCKAGKAVITTAGNLPAKKVIHTVGPIYMGGNNNEAELLANCYINSLQLAVDNNLRTISFPSISTGVYRYPKQEAAIIAVKTVKEYLQTNEGAFDEIIFVCFDDETHFIYRQLVD